jgi:hypothetical protein
MLPLCLVMLTSVPAAAWENGCSHPRITNNAISLLYDQVGMATQQPLYSEFNLPMASGQMDIGATSEDDDPNGATHFVVFNHFYDPHTHLTLHDESVADSLAFANFSLLVFGCKRI